MDEVIKSIKAFLYDRAVSPLFGAYIAAWSVWNYRVFVTLLDGDSRFSEKMAFFDAYFGAIPYQFNGHYYYLLGSIVHGILCPAALTFVYLYFYPWLAKPVYIHSLAKQKELKEIKQDVENARLLTVDESRNLQKEIEQLRYKADEDAQRLRTRISSLTETINNLESSQKSPIPVKTEKYLDNNKLTEMNKEYFNEVIKNKVNKLPDGEFELSKLLESEGWSEFAAPTRSRYGKWLKTLVENGKIENVVISGKGSANQQLYLKGSHQYSNSSEDSKKILLARYPFLSNNKITDELINKLEKYCQKTKISLDMLDILIALVFADGKVGINDLKKMMKGRWSNIEIDHLLKTLSDRGLIYRDDFEGEIRLTAPGNAMAVASGLTEIQRFKPT